MFSIIIVALVVIVLVYFAYKDISKVPFNTHKLMNNSHYLELTQHNDLNRFLEEFEQIKSELRISHKSMFKYSLFHNDIFKDDSASMNGNIFRINSVKYVAKDFSDYQKAVKVIRDHYNYCKKNNIYSEWI